MAQVVCQEVGAKTMTTTSTDTAVKTLYRCSVCGKITEWDPELGGKPLCVTHWDIQADRQIAYRRDYYLNNKGKCDAKSKVYREAHKEQTAAANLAWREAHQDEVRAARQAWNKAHPRLRNVTRIVKAVN